MSNANTNAVQTMHTVTGTNADNEAADLAAGLMTLDGCLGCRVYKALRSTATVRTYEVVGWTVQAFFRPGTIEGRPVLLTESLCNNYGLTYPGAQ
jgi:hypothetical protein